MARRTTNRRYRHNIMIVLILIILVLMFGINKLWAQETLYTHYKETPLLTNPSLLGSKSILKANILHRSQELMRSVKLNSSILNVEVPQLSASRVRRFGGWGISLLHSALNDDLPYTLQGISAGYAYNLPLYKDHYLSFGMQMSYLQRKISLEDYTTGSQWNILLGYDGGVPLGESLDKRVSSYLTGGAGLTYYVEDEHERQLFYLGVGSFNINQPNISFTEREDLAEIRYSGQFGISLLKSEKYLLGPEVLYVYDNHMSRYHVGARGSYYFKNDNPFDMVKDGHITMKLGYRVKNAMTVEMQIYQPNFAFGFSYDAAVSSSQREGAYGSAFEIMLSIRKVFSRRKVKKSVKSSYSSMGEVRNFYFRKQEEVARQRVERSDEDEITSANEELAELNKFGQGTFKFKLKQDFKFDFNGAQINAEAKSYLKEMAELLASNPDITVEIIGHTDNIGSNEVNERVSILRAANVMDHLVELGVDRRRLKITAKGATSPIVPNDTEANKAQNRRVEFVIYSK